MYGNKVTYIEVGGGWERIFLTRKFPIKLIRCRIEAFMKVEERRNVTSLSKFVYQKLIYQSSITKLAIFYITVIYQNYNMPKVYEKFLRPQILVYKLKFEDVKNFTYHCDKLKL